ncbi:MAG TPA: orotidine-5'-phosphate decarboxylase [Hyphomonadaceae bacterium]
MTGFADRLVAATRKLGPLCVGIDPHPSMIPELFGPPAARSAGEWGRAVVDACVGRVAVVKPQAALFERWGSRGMIALEEVCAAAKDAGLIVILDAKRGDIGTTAEGYAEGYLGLHSSCPCDAITVNPYMGVETLEPFVTLAEKYSKGVVVLARTSNPGAKDFQAKLIDGEPLYVHVARSLAPMIRRLKGESGWSGLMLVAGATGPEDAARLRAAAGEALFLVPGYGAQGAGPRDAMASFVRGPAGLEGGVISASRSVAMPEAAKTARDGEAWYQAVSSAIEAAQAELIAAARARD